MTILIVEDSTLQAELLRRALQEAGYQVLHARNGAEGLELTRANHPAVVVTDINLPIMDGYELCRSIRHDEAVKLTPVILLTMLSDPLDVIRGLNAGADAYMTKPCKVPILLARIESLLTFLPDLPPTVESRKVEVRLAGETHLVDAHGPRMLNLMVSIYENAVQQNLELMATHQALEYLNQNLEQKVLEKSSAIAASEARYRRLFETAYDGLLIVDVESAKIIDVNPFLTALLGSTREQFLGKKLWEIRLFEEVVASQSAFAELKRQGYLRYEDLPLLTSDGRKITVEFVGNVYEANGGKVIQCNIHDITERKHTEEQLKRLNWARQALGRSNSALVHACDERNLLQECCDAIAGTEGYALAWIGLALDDPARSIDILALAGDTPEFMDGIEVSWADTPLGQGPCGTAIRTKSAQVINDLSTSSSYPPWIERAKACAYASSASVFINIDDVSFGVLTVYSRERDAFGGAEMELLKELADDIGYGIRSRRTQIAYEDGIRERAEQAVRLLATFESAIGALAATVEQRDPYTAGHQRRVAELAVAIGRELGLDQQIIKGLRVAGLIHDIGKIYVPAEILARPTKLSSAEFEIIKSHPQVGFDIIKGVDFPWPVAQVILQHHERLDGSGYPLGLKGGQIVLEARILAVADVVEAMSSHRPYRPGLGLDAALEEVEKNQGTKFDADAVSACLRLFRDKGYQIPE